MSLLLSPRPRAIAPWAVRVMLASPSPKRPTATTGVVRGRRYVREMTDEVAATARGTRPLSPALAGFLTTWQPRQRRTAGMLATLFVRLDAMSRVHPEWARYDLTTHLLAALHLVIETDRLTGGHTRDQVVDELIGLVSADQPADPPQRHRDIAGTMVDLLTNARDRHVRFRDQHVVADQDGELSHAEPTFHFVELVGPEKATEGTLRATPAAINIFQNLFEFDPLDRAAAERYRSERMLQRRDYDQVVASIERRSTSVHALRSQIEQLQRRIRFNVRAVDYTAEVIPRLDEALNVVAEQVDAEERFAVIIAEHTHQHAPDRVRLERITEHLRNLIQALIALHRTVSGVKQNFEFEQDRQLFTHHEITINPQPDLLVPLLNAAPESVIDVLAKPLAVWLGPRTPRLINLRSVMERMVPTVKQPSGCRTGGPFDFGDVRENPEDLDAALLNAVAQVLAAVREPTSLAELLTSLDDRDLLGELTADQRSRLPWALAVTVTSAYGVTDPDESSEAGDAAVFDHSWLAVVRSGEPLRYGRLAGDDLVLVPRTRLLTNTLEDPLWTPSTPAR